MMRCGYSRLALLAAAMAVIAAGRAATPDVSSQPANPPGGPDPGALEIYPFMTHIGVVARRTLRDSAGRISRRIYYGQKSGEPRVTGPWHERELTQRSALTTRYDDGGRLSATEEC